VKYYDYMGMNKIPGEIGLEVETEASKAYNFLPEIEKYWHVHQDGSLRTNGWEYTFAAPLDRDSKKYSDAMEAFDKQSQVTKFIESPYSSVHVHLNMLDKEVIQMVNFLVLYFIFEEPLTEYCGPNRYSNLFCLNTGRAEYVYKVAKDMVKAIDNLEGYSYIRNLNNGTLKYSGINLVPLRTFGSLEVRTHPGTWKVEEINRWVDILLCLYRAADTFKDPVEIVNRLLGCKSRLDFMENIFGKFLKYLPTDNLQKKIEDGIWYATSIAGAAEWKNFGNKKTDKQAVKRKLTQVEHWIDEAAQLTPATFAPGTLTWATNTVGGAGTVTNTLTPATQWVSIHPTTDQ